MEKIEQWLWRSILNALGDRNLVKWLTGQTCLNVGGVLNPPQDSFDHGNNWPTFLLAPGYLCNNWAMSHLWEQLKESGNVAYAPWFGLWWWDMDTSALKMHQRIEKLLKKDETNGDLRIIGHSQWWLISAKALSPSVNTSGLEIPQLTTCATPFLWAPLAQLTSAVSLGARQINTPRWYLTESIDKYVRELITCISTQDTFVPPISQRIPEEIFSDSKVLSFKGTHTDFIVWPKVPEFLTLLKQEWHIG